MRMKHNKAQVEQKPRAHFLRINGKDPGLLALLMNTSHIVEQRLLDYKKFKN